eukprot:1744321-Rhodomonas_salina.1
MWSKYCSTVHSLHGPPSGPTDPASQMQLSCESLIGGDTELAGQMVGLSPPPAHQWFAVHA